MGVGVENGDARFVFSYLVHQTPSACAGAVQMDMSICQNTLRYTIDTIVLDTLDLEAHCVP